MGENICLISNVSKGWALILVLSVHVFGSFLFVRGKALGLVGMKKILVLMVMVSSVAVAQNRTNVWMIGYSFSETSPKCGFDFSDDSLQVFSLLRHMSFFLTDASICDTNGTLLFYSNGEFIENSNHDTLLNSTNFNPGWLTDYYLDGLGICGGAIIIPRPDSAKQYLIFSESAEIITTPQGGDAQPLELRYSIVDMNLDNGLGGIPMNAKEIVAIEDTLSLGRIAACKHANGRDWWILVHQYFNDKYYKVLVTPDSIYGPFEQEIGFHTSSYDAVGAATFSPDGSKYVMMENRDSVDIFDFDRCTGELSNEIYVAVPDSYVTTGCSFSSSGRYLYVGSLFRIFQYDMWAADIPSSVVQVAEYDTVVGLARWFSPMQNGNDGRIYITTWSGSHFMHYIKFPDSLGIACTVIQSGVYLPSYNDISVPNFPNYDLGALTGSPCDTLSIPLQAFQPPTPTFHFSPNPASSYINIVYSVEHDATLTITNAYGIAVKQLTLYPYFKNRIAYLNDLAAGIYLVTLHEGNKISSKKLIVER